jgi:hypothetical protein
MQRGMEGGGGGGSERGRADAGVLSVERNSGVSSEVSVEVFGSGSGAIPGEMCWGFGFRVWGWCVCVCVCVFVCVSKYVIFLPGLSHMRFSTQTRTDTHTDTHTNTHTHTHTS